MSQDVMTIIERFMAAWGERDLAALGSLMTEDCVYEASVGPEPGTTFHGKAQVLEGIAHMFEVDAGSRSETVDMFATGDRCVSEWRYLWREPDGEREVRGVDVFQIRDGLVCRKNAFRKVRG